MIENKKVKKAKHAFDQVRFKKNEGSKWKTQIGIKHLASFCRYIQFGRIDK